MAEQTLIFHRATLPDETVLLAPPDETSGYGHMTITAVTRNHDGAYVGSHVRELDPYAISRYEVGFGEPSGQTNFRHVAVTVHTADGTETIEVARGGEIQIAAISVNEDGHRTQPYQHRVPAEGLDAIEISTYRLRPTGRTHTTLGLVVGKQPVRDEYGQTVGWTPVYDRILVPETVVV